MKAFYVMSVVFAVLLFAAPIASAQDGWPGCPSAYAMGYLSACLSGPAAEAAAPKPVVLAAPAPAEAFVPCSFGESIDPLLDPMALVCLTQSAPAANAASKPAGLAKPAPTVDPKQGLRCPLWGDVYDLMMTLTYGPECFSPSAANVAAPKPAGLAKPAPAPAQQQFGPCGSSGESPDPLFLVCLR